MSYLNLSPDPAALIESMRDIGYSMETAIADLIDNSITAGATKIDIRFSWNDKKPWLAIIDNGHGMSSDELTNAMKLGSKNPLEERDLSDLGRFGLGLKTASFSQCRKLTVISSRAGNIQGREWDLDLIANETDGEWKLRVLKEEELNIQLFSYDIKQHGTIVLWCNMDRLDNKDRPGVGERKMNTLLDQTRRHLELVYHRFLSGDPGIKKLVIAINGHELEPFDPYNNSVKSATQMLPVEVVPVQGAEIRIQPFILPHHSKVSKSDYEKYAGEAGYLRNQGFYVYRNRRLIINGTWFRLARQEELTKLARVQIDIPNSLDHLWSIDIKKSRATPPEVIREKLRQIINRIRESGAKVYRQKGQKLTSSTKEPFWVRKATEGKIRYEINKTHPLIAAFESSIEEKHRELLRDLLTAIESRFPTETFFNDVAGNPEKVEKIELESGVIKCLAKIFINNLRDAEVAEEEIPKKVLEADPFSRVPELTNQILSSEGFSI